MEPIITLKNLTKSYGETLAVDHVNLEVNKGEASLYWACYDVAKFRLKRAKMIFLSLLYDWLAVWVWD